MLLKRGSRHGILYRKYDHGCIEYFSNADWVGSKTDKGSTTGYYVFIGGDLVSWRYKKQNVLSRSSTEFEYRVITEFACELMWIYQLLPKVGLQTSS